MRLESSMYAGRESLMTHGTALNSVSDNLANSNTVGYKDNRLEFADLLAGSTGNLYGGPLETGNGVKGVEVRINHEAQGTIDNTGRELDTAINGRGWFVLGDKNNIATAYSRAGNFSTDADGNLIAATGERILGYTAASPETLTNINIKNVASTTTATSEIIINGNLDPASALVANLPPATNFSSLGEAASFVTSSRSVDSLGEDRDVTMYFYRTGQLTWTVQAYADGKDIAGGTPGTPSLLGTSQLTIGADGQPLAGAAPLNITPAWADGAAAGAISIDLTKFTGFARGSSVTSTTQNGLKGGPVTGVSFNNEGEVIANLLSGETTIIGSLALAKFASPDGLERVGNNNFRSDDGNSGAATIGRANTEGLGTIQGQSLESSTVDTAKEFIQLIQYQQGYRAGSQVIQMANELISSTIKIA